MTDQTDAIVALWSRAIVLAAEQGRSEVIVFAEALLHPYGVLVEAVRARCDSAVPEWGLELRAALAALEGEDR